MNQNENERELLSTPQPEPALAPVAEVEEAANKPAPVKAPATVPVRKPTQIVRKPSSAPIWVSVLCMAMAICILATFIATNNANRHYYTQKLQQQQAVIDRLEDMAGTPSGEFSQLELLSKIFAAYSYYAGDVSEEELMTAVLKAYAAATGDDYAEYYTDEEFMALTADREGVAVGIGVSVIQTELTVSGVTYRVFQIISIYQGSPAERASLRVGDCIYGIRVDEQYESITALGYDQAGNLIRGEKGTAVDLLIFRASNGGYESFGASLVRDAYEAESVTHKVSKADPTVGIVHINSFDLTTPHQFKNAVLELQKRGVEHFVFDVRNNPGGDLQSIKAVLTYFLQPGDLILSSITRKGQVAVSYRAEPIQFTDEYAACNVSKDEIGMFANLDMVVICNKNTASAAEVFTATMRDYELAPIVGQTTFGKGIMQSFLPMSAFGNFTGYVKMTTYAYVTKCGITYHELVVHPDEGLEIALSPEALEYNFYVLPEELDDQLKLAIDQFK